MNFKFYAISGSRPVRNGELSFFLLDYTRLFTSFTNTKLCPIRLIQLRPFLTWIPLLHSVDWLVFMDQDGSDANTYTHNDLVTSSSPDLRGTYDMEPFLNQICSKEHMMIPGRGRGRIILTLCIATGVRGTYPRAVIPFPESLEVSRSSIPISILRYHWTSL